MSNRRWLQWHLSTLFVVTVVAGVALYANLRTWEKEIRSADGFYSTVDLSYGWPLAYEVLTLSVPQADGGIITTFGPVTLTRWEYAAANFAIIVVLLLALGWLLERWTRNTARKTPTPTPDDR